MKKQHYILIIVFVLSSCVPTQQFKEVSDKGNKLEVERDQLMMENEQLTVENTEMKANMDLVEEEKAKFVEDSIRLYKEISSLKKEVDKLTRQLDDLQATHEALLQGNARETRRLLNELQSTQENLQTKEGKLRELESSVNDGRRDITRMRAELEARNAKLAELERILNRKDSAVNALKESVSRALMGFEGKGLTVERKNGKVYVSMDEKLLFQSGSYDVDARGKQALNDLGAVLARNKDVNIMIEGHTDNVPYRSGAVIRDNWDLSVLRATSVLKILMESGNIDPDRITAAGRGEFQPIDRADTPEARSRNRRTEIILSPKLDELLKLLETN
ncbi:MAG: OmpA family protein [Bacteroidales bacterium]|nr:OmpA family protein [Bacteroidales bacterium]MCF8392193.1 OmpA family protein [Bacteroidales bacterium]